MKPLIDIFIPIGTGSLHGNIELRYALRSIEKYAYGFDKIFVVGHNPGVLSSKVNFIDGGYIPKPKEIRIAHKIRWIFEKNVMSPDVAFWNDDYVLNAPIDVREIKFFQNGKLEEVIETKVCKNYKQALFDTRNLLQMMGFQTFHYDIHIPIIYNQRRFLNLNDWWAMGEQQLEGVIIKSSYCNNVLTTPGPHMRDVKLIHGGSAVDKEIEGRWVFSYCDRALTTGLLERLEKMFPHKSIYEK